MKAEDRDKEQEYAEKFLQLGLDYEQETGKSHYRHGEYTRHYVEWLECKIIDHQSQLQALKEEVDVYSDKAESDIKSYSNAFMKGKLSENKRVLNLITNLEDNG